MTEEQRKHTVDIVEEDVNIMIHGPFLWYKNYPSAFQILNILSNIGLKFNC